MKIVSVADYAELSIAARDIVVQSVSLQPALTLALPTGSTPIGLYRHLRAEHAAGRFSLGQASVFMLDEYLDLPSYPEGSYRSYLHDHLGGVIFNTSTRLHLLNVEDELVSAQRYDEELSLAGGIDLAIVGLGRNGHVGFNEPYANPAKHTHVVELSASTLAANFAGQANSRRPTRALTMGLGDLLAARSVLMLVAGSSKAPILSALREETFDPSIPATHFLAHQNFTIIADKEALGDA